MGGAHGDSTVTSKGRIQQTWCLQFGGDLRDLRIRYMRAYCLVVLLISVADNTVDSGVNIQAQSFADLELLLLLRSKLSVR